MEKRRYFAEISLLVADLTVQFPCGYCLVISVKPQNNGPCEVNVANAARLIIGGTHRLASEAEVHSFYAAQSVARAQSLPVDGLASARAHYAALTKGRKERSR